jgi:RsiW-degrading membrane proteinase PrsW (M82 family)
VPELIDEARFGLWFGIGCAVWVGAFVVAAAVRRDWAMLRLAACGVLAYLLWLLYRALTPTLDILTVRGVLWLVAIFVALGAAAGLALGARRRE